MSTTIKFLHTLLTVIIYYNFIIPGGISTSSVGIALYFYLYLVNSLFTDLMVFWILYLLNYSLTERELVKDKTTKAYLYSYKYLL